MHQHLAESLLLGAGILASTTIGAAWLDYQVGKSYKLSSPEQLSHCFRRLMYGAILPAGTALGVSLLVWSETLAEHPELRFMCLVEAALGTLVHLLWPQRKARGIITVIAASAVIGLALPVLGALAQGFVPGHNGAPGYFNLGTGLLTYALLVAPGLAAGFMTGRYLVHARTKYLAELQEAESRTQAAESVKLATQQVVARTMSECGLDEKYKPVVEADVQELAQRLTDQERQTPELAATAIYTQAQGHGTEAKWLTLMLDQAATEERAEQEQSRRQNRDSCAWIVARRLLRHATSPANQAELINDIASMAGHLPLHLFDSIPRGTALLRREWSQYGSQTAYYAADGALVTSQLFADRNFVRPEVREDVRARIVEPLRAALFKDESEQLSASEANRRLLKRAQEVLRQRPDLHSGSESVGAGTVAGGAGQ